jgi:hypothetical protein
MRTGDIDCLSRQHCNKAHDQDKQTGFDACSGD